MGDDLSIGSTVAGYRLDALIARGGMGVVYKATHLALERSVALKVIARQYAGDAAFRDRFLRESRLAARLEHPAVVPVYDAREEDGELIVAMRLIAGGDLKQRIEAGGPLPVEEAVGLLGQVADALDAAHAEGIVHRDVKPHNILLEGERAYLTDFGLAKALGESGVLRGASVVGTAEYMAPEQWRGGEVGPAADVYSLGCVLYEALTGIAPFARRDGDAEPRMPAGLGDVIERAVAPRPAARYGSAGELIAAAREREAEAPAPTRVLSERPPGLSRWRRYLGAFLAAWFALPVAIGIVATVAVAAWFALNGDEVSVSDPIPVGQGPLRLAAGARSVWVTSSRDGTLSRIDAATRELAGEPLRLGRGVSGVAVGAGSVWVSSPRTGEVLRVDGDAGEVAARIPVGGRPGAIVVGGGRVWVADEAGAGVSAINPAGNRVFKRGIAPHAAPLRLAYGAGAVWVSSAGAGTVTRIDPTTVSAEAPIRVGRGPAGITVGSGLVWVANSRSGTVTRVDPSLRAIVGDRIEVGARPGGIDAGTSTIWVANAGGDNVTRIAIESAETRGDPITVGSRPGAVAIGAGALWVANNGDGSIVRVQP